MSCSWLPVSSTSEYLSKERIRPVSLTPLSRYRVMAVLSLRAVLRKESWMFCAGLFSICRSPLFETRQSAHENVGNCERGQICYSRRKTRTCSLFRWTHVRYGVGP